VRTFSSALWERWTRVGRRLGDVQARVVLTLFYFLVVTPFALAVRIGSDPLGIRPGSARGWRSRPPAAGSPLERARRQS
jgi:hypothetical protein